MQVGGASEAGRQKFDELDPTGAPKVLLVAGDCPRDSRLVVLSGSFNPPTRAHVGLAAAALATGQFDRLLFTLAVRTINKEQVDGATLAERCRMLDVVVRPEPRWAVLGSNRGLYLDQAIAIHAAFAPRDLAFVVGFDKIVQIVDPRYYADRDTALREIFAQARFLVAPRDGAGPAELERLFAKPEHRAYAGRVQFLPLSQLQVQEQRLSSTQVRQLLAGGADVSWAVPEAVRPLLGEIMGYKDI